VDQCRIDVIDALAVAGENWIKGFIHGRRAR
jgi:hypothetical protein